MSSWGADWLCSECDAALEHKQSRHAACKTPTRWVCRWPEASGAYSSYKRHAKCCTHCSPDRLREIVASERADTENRLTTTAETESSQSAPTPARHMSVNT